MASESWLPIPSTSHFSLANIPFGIISHANAPSPRPAIAIGTHALDLEIFSNHAGFSSLPAIQPHIHVFSSSTLNPFASLGRPVHRAVRSYIQAIFKRDGPYPHLLERNPSLRNAALIPLDKVTTQLPMRIGDYTDFYAGKHHAFTVGELFRGPDKALQPNYCHLPVGYHGRASSVVVSGTGIRRPNGQVVLRPGEAPELLPSRKLDIELELAAFVCGANGMGTPIEVDEAGEYLFGVVLLNDWSARDVQAWEYVPLGPFNGKNFGTSVSAWVVLMDALEGFRTAGIENEVEVLPYLRSGKGVLDVNLEVEIKTASGSRTTISRTNGRNLLFSFEQMLAHHTVGGCPFNTGDMLGSGTISGTQPDTRGSLLEMNQNGKVPIRLNNDEERIFLQDGDEVTLRGWCGGEPGALVGFGECVGRIESAIDLQSK